jgi:hypothetical protein
MSTLKNKQHKARGKNAPDQIHFPLAAFGFFNPDAREVIDHDRYAKDQNIHRNKRHVKPAADRKQQHPAKAVREHEVKQRHGRKEDQELEGVKEH